MFVELSVLFDCLFCIVCVSRWLVWLDSLFVVWWENVSSRMCCGLVLLVIRCVMC